MKKTETDANDIAHMAHLFQERSISFISKLLVNFISRFYSLRLANINHSFSVPQYFVFDFHMAPLMLFDKIITLTVSLIMFMIISIHIMVHISRIIYKWKYI